MTPEEENAYREGAFDTLKLMFKSALYAMAILFIVGLIIIGFLSSCSKPTDLPTPDRPTPHKSASTNLMPNGGGQNTTDFDGRQSAWVIRSGKGGTKSGSPYWSGNYQHIQARSQFSLISPKPVNKSGTGWVEYALTVKYRSTVPVLVAVKYADNCTYVICTMPVATKPMYYYVSFDAPRVDWIKWYNKAGEAGEMELDEVNLY